MIPPEHLEAVDEFRAFRIEAFTTTRQAGSFASSTDEPVRDVMGRWDALRAALAARGVRRLATAPQVHGAGVLVHQPGWEGWLRGPHADGHVSLSRGTGLAVTIADCVPVFLAHPSGAVGLLHSGWRGTAARIVTRAVEALERGGVPPGELHVHLGPAICGACYEVSADVLERLTGGPAGAPGPVDLRAIIAGQARDAGVRAVTSSARCTRCDNIRFYSHRAGDAGRQVAVVVATPP